MIALLEGFPNFSLIFNEISFIMQAIIGEIVLNNITMQWLSITKML